MTTIPLRSRIADCLARISTTRGDKPVIVVGSSEEFDALDVVTELGDAMGYDTLLIRLGFSNASDLEPGTPFSLSMPATCSKSDRLLILDESEPRLADRDGTADDVLSKLLTRIGEAGGTRTPVVIIVSDSGADALRAQAARIGAWLPTASDVIAAI